MTELDDLRAFIANARWIFARTMPQNPHWYTLRKEDPQEGFEAFVIFIREHGYREEYGGRWYIKFDLDGWSYWTMGAPLKETILINRKKADEYHAALGQGTQLESKGTRGIGEGQAPGRRQPPGLYTRFSDPRPKPRSYRTLNDRISWN